MSERNRRSRPGPDRRPPARGRARAGLEDELRLARAITTWDALVAERVPPAAGACRLVRLEPDAIVVDAEEPIVAAELRMRASELLDAFAAAPGGRRARFLRLVSDPPERPGSPAGPPRIIPVRSASRGRHALPSGVVAHSMRLAAWPFVSS